MPRRVGAPQASCNTRLRCQPRNTHRCPNRTTGLDGTLGERPSQAGITATYHITLHCPVHDLIPIIPSDNLPVGPEAQTRDCLVEAFSNTSSRSEKSKRKKKQKGFETRANKVVRTATTTRHEKKAILSRHMGEGKK